MVNKRRKLFTLAALLVDLLSLRVDRWKQVSILRRVRKSLSNRVVMKEIVMMMSHPKSKDGRTDTRRNRTTTTMNRRINVLLIEVMCGSDAVISPDRKTHFVCFIQQQCPSQKHRSQRRRQWMPGNVVVQPSLPGVRALMAVVLFSKAAEGSQLCSESLIDSFHALITTGYFSNTTTNQLQVLANLHSLLHLATRRVQVRFVIRLLIHEQFSFN